MPVVEDGYYWYQHEIDDEITIIEVDDDIVWYMGSDEFDYLKDLKGKITKKIERPILEGE